MKYYKVDSIEINFGINGVYLQFYGTLDPDSYTEKYTMVFPDIKTALEVVESIHTDNKKVVDKSK